MQPHLEQLSPNLPLNQYIKSSLKQYFANFDGNKKSEHKNIVNLYKLVLTEVEKPLLEIVLEYTNDNQSLAAKLLGISRNTLRKLINLYKL
jgi:Fis family transcriptional regulator, factor for inversion stimulation protein